jgi:hypothetical protein
MLVGWLDNGGSAYLEAHGLDADELVARTRTEEPGSQERARRLVDRFLAQVATGPHLVDSGTSP